MKEKIYNLTVTKHINGPYRQYALYTLEHRGIPNFYDALTNVQRLVLIHAPSKFTKTLGVSGTVMATGHYHHGDSSLNGAISKLAKKFGCSESILEGDGFFGSPVKHEPAAPRYTQVKLNSKINDVIKKNWSLNETNVEGAHEKLEVEFPIGLLTHIIGIAVGYATNIMPRRFEDIEDFLEKKISTVTPYFKNFTGTVTPHLNSWIIQGVHKVDHNKREIRITEIPPVMKYETFLSKLESISERFNIKVANNSTKNIDITLKLVSGDNNNWIEFVEAIDKSNKILFTENIVVIKDSKVVEYDKIEDYLDDFRLIRLDVQKRKVEQEIKDHLNEDEFLRKKILFIQYMVTKQHTAKEVDDWIDTNAQQYLRRLDAVRAKELVKETIDIINNMLKENDKIRKGKEKKLTDLIKLIDKITKTHISRAKVTTNKSESSDIADDDEEFEKFDPSVFLEEEIE